jgi:photosystem II stability/assembly factor-like uncharacterized protein
MVIMRKSDAPAALFGLNYHQERTLSMKRTTFSLILFSLAIGLLAFSFSRPATAENAASEGVPYTTDWRITGPSGGDVRALVIDPNDPTRFYFGTLDGQIYTSSDGARTWRLLVNFIRPQLFVDNIIIDPRDSKVLYVATHRHKEPGGFYKSIDGGATWKMSDELKSQAIHSLAQSRRNRDWLWAGTNTGVWKSMDAGRSWKQLPTTGMTNINIESLAIDPRDDNVIYAGSWHLPFKTTDGGQSWRVTNNGIIDDSDVFAIDINERDADHIIASACSGIYETKNAGDSWKKIQGIPSQSRRTRAILQHPTIPGLVFAGTTEGFWRSARGGENNSWMVTTSRQLEINSIAVHPQTPNDVYIATNNYGVMVSRDGGKNFVPTNAGFSGRFVNSIVHDREQPNRVYATTINTTTGGGFFFVSNDGGATWQPSMRNMPPRLIGYAILQDERTANTIYLGTNLGVYRSLDRGASWSTVVGKKPSAPKKPANRRAAARRPASSRNAAARSQQPATGPGQRIVASAPQASDDVVRKAQEALDRAGYQVGVADGRVGQRTVAAIKRFQADRYLPVNGQLDQTTIAALGLGSVASNLLAHITTLTEPVNSLVTFSDGSGKLGMLAATNGGLYRTFDAAEGWNRVNYGSGFDARTSAISTSAQNPQLVFVGTTSSGVLVSRDGGETWQQVSGVPTTSPINVIVQDPFRASHIYVGTKTAFYMSHDGGQSWSRRGGDLPFGDFSSILINPRNTNEIFAGNAFQNGATGGGVYRSSNAGETWTRIDVRELRLPSMRIWALALDPRDQSTLFVGSHSAGVYVVPRGAEASLNSLR